MPINTQRMKGTVSTTMTSTTREALTGKWPMSPSVLLVDLQARKDGGSVDKGCWAEKAHFQRGYEGRIIVQRRHCGPREKIRMSQQQHENDCGGSATPKTSRTFVGTAGSAWFATFQVEGEERMKMAMTDEME